LKFLQLDWKGIKSVRLSKISAQEILEKHKTVFEPGNGKLVDINGKLSM
jgi:hypothetical protein